MPRKSAVLRAGVAVLGPLIAACDRETEIAAAKFRRAKVEHEAAMAEWRAKRKKSGPAVAGICPNEPEPQKHFVALTTDPTREALAQRLSASRSVVLAVDEAGGWLLALCGGDKLTQRGELLSYWSGATVRHDRKTAETVKVDWGCVALAGGIQPELFGELVEKGRDDGLIERFQLLCRVGAAPWAGPMPAADITPMHSLIATLSGGAIPQPIGQIIFDDQAVAAFTEYGRAVGDHAERVMHSTPRLAAWLSKSAQALAAIAAIFAAADGRERVAPADVLHGSRIVDWYAAEVRSLIGDELSPAAARLATKLDKLPQIFSTRDVTMSSLVYPRKKERAKALLDELVATGILDMEGYRYIRAIQSSAHATTTTTNLPSS